jgi:glycosyltransferase involved in cell wall biosynthesis
MRASVLIGAHNEGSRLWRTVESILESGIGKSAEIVVADDASSDDSVSELKKRFPQIVVVEQPERSGVSSTRGLAVRQARGDTLVFLDGHTKPGRGSIERLVSSVERTSGKAIITPRIEGLDGETWKSLPQQLGSGYALDLETFDSWWISEKKMKEVKVRLTSSLRHWWVVHWPSAGTSTTISGASMYTCGSTALKTWISR